MRNVSSSSDWYMAGHHTDLGVAVKQQSRPLGARVFWDEIQATSLGDNKNYTLLIVSLSGITKQLESQGILKLLLSLLFLPSCVHPGTSQTDTYAYFAPGSTILIPGTKYYMCCNGVHVYAP